VKFHGSILFYGAYLSYRYAFDSAGYDKVLLFSLLVFFLLQFSFLLEGMFGFLLLFLLSFIFFTCVTHIVLLSMVRFAFCLWFYIMFAPGVTESSDMSLAYNQNNLRASDFFLPPRAGLTAGLSWNRSHKNPLEELRDNESGLLWVGWFGEQSGSEFIFVA